MSCIIAQNSVRCILLVVGVFAVVNSPACSNPEKHIVAIAGTELVTLPESPWGISVSPDERWLAFWELRQQGGDPYDALLCTLDLTNYSKTTHSIQGLYEQLFSLGPVEPWSKIAGDFRDACWLDNQCHVVLRFFNVRKTLAFTPGTAQAAWSSPQGSLTCSDCPPPGLVGSTVVELVGGWLLSYGTKYSVSCKDGRIGRSIYHLDPRCDDVCIAKTDSSGSQLVVQHPSRKFHNIGLVTLRISPDESYLAYGLLSKLRAPIPLPDQAIELHVYDLKQKKDHEVSSGYRYMSNLIWSPDSQRLYFAGFQGDMGAVYRVAVDEVLEE